MKLLKGPYHFMALLGWLHLMLFALLWDGGIDASRAAWAWVIVKLIPLGLLLPGIVRASSFSMQLASMIVLLYMVEGCVRGMTSAPPSSMFGWAQFVLSWMTFFGLVLHLRPLKQAAKAQKKQEENLG
jgi:uncharacterized membrane protein